MKGRNPAPHHQLNLAMLLKKQYNSTGVEEAMQLINIWDYLNAQLVRPAWSRVRNPLVEGVQDGLAVYG